jgi:hypothetical protein
MLHYIGELHDHMEQLEAEDSWSRPVARKRGHHPVDSTTILAWRCGWMVGNEQVVVLPFATSLMQYVCMSHVGGGIATVQKGNLGSVCFSFSSLFSLVFDRSKSWMIQKVRS